MPQTENVSAFPMSRKERKRLLRRSRDGRLRMLLVARTITGWALAIGVIAFIMVNYRLFAPESIKRWTSYAKMGITATTGDLTTINYSAGSVVDAVLFQGGLALADSDTLYVAKPGGLSQLSVQLSYANMTLDTAGEYVLAYDRGSTGITLASALAPRFQTTMTSNILCATVAQNGNCAVVTDESGYKSAVTVLDADGKQVYKWSSSEYYVQSAAISPTGKRLAALAFRLNGAQVETSLLFFDINSDSIAAQSVLGSTLGLEVRFLSEDTVGAVADTATFLAKRDGTVITQMTYDAVDFMGFAFDSDQVAVATRSYQQGARSQVVLLSTNGKTSAPLYLSEELQSFAMKNKTVCVLTTAGLHLFDSNFTPLWSDATASGGRRVLLGEDGTAFVLFSKQARLFSQNYREEPAHAITIAEASTNTATNPQ